MDGSSRLRASLRLAGLLAVTAVAALAAFALMPLGLVTARGRRRGAARVFHGWARWVARLLGVAVEVSGPLPQPPFLLVTNHLSYLDVVVLESILPCVFVAKADVRAWPVVGPLCRLVDTVFIDRTMARDIPRAMAEIAAALAHGHGVVLFPEGTSTAGAAVAEFRSPLLAVASRLEQPVHHAALSYRTPGDRPEARLAVCWWGDMPFASHVFTLLGIARMTATVRLAAAPLPPGDRKELARELHAAVSALFTPVAQGAETPAPQAPGARP